MYRLSHSQKNKYQNCPRAYYISYLLLMRRIKTTSALVFGSAIDDALNSLLIEKDLIKANLIFLDKLAKPEINGQTVDIGSNLSLRSKHIHFYKGDSDVMLFKAGETVDPYEAIKRKGLLFLDQYNSEILPQIREVLSVQEKISIENNIGDSITGLIDFVAVMNDGSTVIWDNKTSSKAYAEDCIALEGDQLGLYNMAVGEKYKADKVGYIVMNKKLRAKKEPQVRIQMISGTVPEELTNKVIHDFNDVLQSIKMGQFQSNHPKCTQGYDFEPCVCQTYNPDDYSGFVSIKK